MKKLLIISLIIVNLLTLYFFVFPYQSFSDYNSLQEVYRAFSAQKDMLNTSIDYNLRDLSKEVEAYPQFKSNEDLAQQIHDDFKQIRYKLEFCEDAVYEQIRNHYSIAEYGKLPPNDFWFRIQPFHYQIPKKVLFESEILGETIERIHQKQTTILKSLNDADFEEIAIDSFLIDTENLSQLFKHQSFMQTVSIIKKLESQIKMAEQEITNQILEDTKNRITKNQLKLQYFTPMVSTRKSIIKRGEIFEAEIFTAPIMTHDSLKFFINGQPFASENGVVNYEFTPTSTKPKRFYISVEIQSLFNPKEKQKFRKEFEIPVSRCQ